MKIKLMFLVLALGWTGNPAQAKQPKPFLADTLASIEMARKGKPFLLVLWSLDCAPCYGELEHIKTVLQEGRALDVVFVSTDTPDRAANIENTLSEYGLGKLDSWVFSDPVPERLRYKIDPKWYGELPRAYFYDKRHARTPYSGAISLEGLRGMAAVN